MTVEEISEELGVSKQSIYKKIKKPEFEEFIYYEDGVKKISKEGVNILKGKNPNIEIIEKQLKEIEDLKLEKKFLMDTINQQNSVILKQTEIIKDSQKLEQQAMENTKIALTSVEKMLVEKRKELDARKASYEANKGGILRKIFMFFTISRAKNVKESY